MRIGVDIVQIARMSEKFRMGEGFAERVYSHQELQIAKSFSQARSDQFLAGRFAVKEAVVKALRMAIGDGSVLREIETLIAEDGSPQMMLSGRPLEIAERVGLKRYEVSLSHEAGLVIAFVLLN